LTSAALLIRAGAELAEELGIMIEIRIATGLKVGVTTGLALPVLVGFGGSVWIIVVGTTVKDRLAEGLGEGSFAVDIGL
jgi:hypothetical protein